MIVRSRFVRSHAQEHPATLQARLLAYLGYLAFRPDAPGVKRETPRALFDATEAWVNRERAAACILAAGCPQVRYHQLLLAPGGDEPVLDARAWTRALLADLGRHRGLVLTYVGAIHAEQHLHVHVVLAGTGREHDTASRVPLLLRPADFAYLRARGRAQSAERLLAAFVPSRQDNLLPAHPLPDLSHLLPAHSETAPAWTRALPSAPPLDMRGDAPRALRATEAEEGDALWSW